MARRSRRSGARSRGTAGAAMEYVRRAGAAYLPGGSRRACASIDGRRAKASTDPTTQIPFVHTVES
jgi:hypothetical protein